MVQWNERQLEELVRKMGLERTPGQQKSPIHLSLYGPLWNPEPLLTQIMRLDANEWQILGYAETDRVSVTRYLGSLKCRTDGALWVAARYQRPLAPELAKLLVDAGASDEGALWVATRYQQPLTSELAKALIDAGAFDKSTLSIAAQWQHPLSLELAKLLIDAGAFNERALRSAVIYQRPLSLELTKTLINAGCDPAEQNGSGRDSLVWLAIGGYSVDPQVTDLFLSCGCRRDLDGCERISDEHRLRFDQILKEHAEWKESLSRMSAENFPANTFYDPDWGR